MRSGARTLTLLGTPRIFLILQSLGAGTKSRLELRRDAGSLAQSTMRSHLRTLEEAAAIVQRKQSSFPGALEYELTDAGQELLVVAESLEHWLADAPQGPLELGGDQAKAAVKGLVTGWSANVLAALAEEPLSLTELDKRISAVNYPTIERCLETMRLAEQLDAVERNGRGTPYAITGWLRRGLAPLVLAARWEYRHGADDLPPIRQTDISDALALVAPLVEVPARLVGIGEMALKMKIPNDKQQHRHMAFIEVRNGQISFGVVQPERKPDASMAGTTDTWFSAVADADTSGLKLSGDRNLAETILERLHEALFVDRAKAMTEPRAQGW